MSELIQKIQNDIKRAMMSKDTETLEALRNLKSEIVKRHGANPSDKEVLDVVSYLVKTQNKSAEVFQSNGRTDLADNEFKQIKIINRYAPEQISVDKLKWLIDQVIKNNPNGNLGLYIKKVKQDIEDLGFSVDNKFMVQTIKDLLT